MARPTKLNADTQAAIVNAIKLGVPLDTAAQAAGVHYATFAEWMSKGAAAKSGQYHEFHEAVNKAKAYAQEQFVKVITGAAMKGDWKAAAWYLARTNRKEFGDALKIDVTQLSDDDIIRLLSLAAGTPTASGSEAATVANSDQPAGSE